MYNFYLDNILLESTPDGFDEFSFEIKREIATRKMVVQYPTNLTFYGDGFNILYDAIQRDGYDKTFELRIDKISQNQNTARTIYGIIFLIDVEFDLTQRTATTQVKENGYLAKIWNNEDNPITLPCLSSKNGEPIPTNIPQLIQITFDGVTAINSLNPYNAGNRYGIDVHNALKVMVANMSDNDVEFESTFLDDLLTKFYDTNNGFYAPLILIKGKELRLGAQRESDDDYLIKTTFNDLVTAISHIYNLYLFQNSKVQPPILKLEHESKFYGTDVQTTMDLPENTKMSFYQNLFYSTIKVGGVNLYEQGNTATNIPNLPFVSFKQSEFYLDGKSNINQPYEITIDEYIVDSNIIRDVLLNNDTSYDENIFMIQYRPDYLDAVSFRVLGENAFNGGLTPDQYVNYHNLFGKITSNLTSVSTDGRFSLLQTSDDIQRFTLLGLVSVMLNTYNIQQSYSQTIFDYTDGQLSSSVYTALKSGMYTFRVSHTTNIVKLENKVIERDGGTNWQYNLGDGYELDLLVFLEVRNGTDVVSQAVVRHERYNRTGLHILANDVTLNLNANETVRVITKYAPYDNTRTGTRVVDYNIDFYTGGGDSTFQCLASQNLLLTYGATNQSNAYRGTRINLEYYLDQTQIQNIIDEPQNSIEIVNFVNDGKSKPCWISNMVINYETGRITAELITNIDKIEQDEAQQTNRIQASRRTSTGCDVGMLCFANENNSQYIELIS